MSEFDFDLWNSSAAAAANSNKASTAHFFPFNGSLLSFSRNLHARNQGPQWLINLPNNIHVPAALFPTAAVRPSRTFSENGDGILDELDQVWDDNNTDDSGDDSSTASSMGLMSTAEKILDVETSSDIASCFSRVTKDAIMEDIPNSGCFSYDEDDSKSATTTITITSLSENSDLMDVIVDDTREMEVATALLKDKLEEQEEDNKPAPSWDRLRSSMKQSRLTQELLQEHDRKQGLPRSHCVTMMHTNRSRRQLEEGRILPKWNGKPLISKEDNATTVTGAGRKGSKKQTTARAA